MKTTSLHRRTALVKASADASLPTVILQSLREKMFKGDFPPGARIVETRLSKELHVGQPAVREALLMLERQGLVRRVANIGTFVRDLNIEEVKNLFEIRTELESLAAERAAQRVTKEGLEELRHLARNLEDVKNGKQRTDRWEHFKRDIAFHQFIWRISENQQLAEILEGVVVPLFHFGFWHHERSSEQAARSIELHLDIVAGIEAGPRPARVAIQKSIRLFSEPYLRNVYSFRK